MSEKTIFFPIGVSSDVKNMSARALAKRLRSSASGLTNAEAARRMQTYGANTLRAGGVSAGRVFLRQFQSSLVYLLVGAMLLAYGINDGSDGGVILAILCLNTALGFLQEYRSEKTIEKLSRFIQKQVRVRRDEQATLVPESEIVPGDVVILREGDIAPADMRVLSAEHLQADEAALTGESVPVTKRATSWILAGSIIEKGTGSAMAYATGHQTELGTIARLSTQTRKDTQYEKSLKNFSAFLVKIVLSGVVLVFVFKLILNGLGNVSQLALFLIAMAVAVVPEILPVITTVSLSRGAMYLAQRHVVVKRLSAIEDLGNVDLLCTDKTGTITQNKMAIKRVVSPDPDFLLALAYAAILPLKVRRHQIQNSYDDAFRAYASPAVRARAGNMSIVKELPFDPEARRRRVLVAERKNQRQYLVVLGAPESILDISHEKRRATYMRAISEEGRTGLHHVALAYRELSADAGADLIAAEHGLHFLGYVSLHDPLRPGVRHTIQLAQRLGISLKILSGDSREVAEYVGREVGLLVDGEKAYLGEELATLAPPEFKRTVLSAQVFARVSPAQKHDIIRVLKEDHVVAYQGDGINDAPALKMADVAIAVNSATDIAKENADIVLLNKSLDVIINGIQAGRSIFVNMNKYIKYTMVSNFGNFIALATLYLISTDLPLLPIQVLLTSVITDIPLILISSDTVAEKDVIRPEKHEVRELILLSLILGLPTALFELFYFRLIRAQALPVVQTGAYVFFTFIALAVFYVVRNKERFWKAAPPPFVLNAAFGLALITSAGLIYVPFFQGIFSFVPLSARAMALILTVTAAYFVAADQMKTWYYRVASRLNTG